MKILSGFFLLLISLCAYSQDNNKPATYNLDKLSFANKPLIVLDGEKKGTDFDLKEIDPENIAKIVVLKGDSARAHYGEAGINGVILVTLKTQTAPSTTIPTISNKPLFIVEGIKKDETFMNTINPNDIESISVLKDANATAEYGDAGKNGVIIISLKKGSIINPIRKIE